MIVPFSYECKVRYEKTMENGLSKKITETYIILDALSFSEAEVRFVSYMQPYISGDMEVVSIKKSKCKEFIGLEDMNADRFFLVKIELMMLDEKTMRESKLTTSVLVKASNIDEAKEKLDISMHYTMITYSVVSVSETPIMDVIGLKL